MPPGLMYALIVDTIWLYEESDTWYNTEAP